MDRILEILGFGVGLLYLWWEYHADVRVWLASMVMPAISMWIYWSKGIYADFAINIYYLLMAVYGYIIWRHGGSSEEKEEEAPRPITHTPAWAWAAAFGCTMILWAAMAWFLRTYTDSTVPLADAFTTSLSIVATWMLARKYAEQWLAWLLVDVVCVGLYAYKGLIFYPVLYAIYCVIAVLGYRKWLRLMRKGEA
ncbi:MAG: nicotinamide riboside transporter PnuC [Muribaculaceae bacterium]|nr:nicotinamide riboside transporter PnuC [Muribaculaceae bacterium]